MYRNALLLRLCTRRKPKRLLSLSCLGDACWAAGCWPGGYHLKKPYAAWMPHPSLPGGDVFTVRFVEGTHCKARSKRCFAKHRPRVQVSTPAVLRSCTGKAQRRRAKGSRTASGQTVAWRSTGGRAVVTVSFKSVSISCPATSIPESRWISRAQVGLVTLISVRLSPMTSRPTK